MPHSMLLPYLHYTCNDTTVIQPAVHATTVNDHVRWFTDNQNVVRILQVGSRMPELHAIALKVLALAVQSQIRIEPEWVPIELNEQADYLSRIVDYDDWFLNPTVFSACSMGTLYS